MEQLSLAKFRPIEIDRTDLEDVQSGECTGGGFQDFTINGESFTMYYTSDEEVQVMVANGNWIQSYNHFGVSFSGGIY